MFKKFLLVALCLVALGVHLPLADANAQWMTFTVTVTDVSPPDDGPVTGLDGAISLNIYNWQDVWMAAYDVEEVEDGVYEVTVNAWTNWVYWRFWCDDTNPALTPRFNVWPHPPNPVPYVWPVEDLRQ